MERVNTEALILSRILNGLGIPKSAADPQVTTTYPSSGFVVSVDRNNPTQSRMVRPMTPAEARRNPTNLEKTRIAQQRSYTPETVAGGFGKGLKEGAKAAANGMAQGVIDIPDSIVTAGTGIANAGNYAMYGAAKAGEWLSGNQDNSTSNFWAKNIEDVKAGANKVRNATGITAARQYYNDAYAYDPNSGVDQKSLKLAEKGGRLLPTAVMLNAAAGNVGTAAQKSVNAVSAAQYPVNERMVAGAVHRFANTLSKVAPRVAANMDKFAQTGLKVAAKPGNFLRLGGYAGDLAEATGVPGAGTAKKVFKTTRTVLMPNVAMNGGVADMGIGTSI